ncbi:MAG: formylglycine-generating enzyme family protein [Nannocystales bacterium]
MDRRLRTVFTLLATCFMGCSSRATAPAGTVVVPTGPSWSGSTLETRAGAVEFLTAAYGPQSMEPLMRLRAEATPHSVQTAAFRIMAHPVTQGDYQAFATATGSAEPWIDATRWAEQETGFPYATAERFMWVEGKPAQARLRHPVVLVDRQDAERYCSWWGDLHGGLGQLPSEAQWNRAASGDEGTAFPWGDRHDPTRANTWETGVGDTTPVGAAPEDVSTFGVHDMAGNVFEWTRTRTEHGASILKGGSWSTSLVQARTAVRKPARDDLRHITIGFRCVFTPRSGD